MTSIRDPHKWLCYILNLNSTSCEEVFSLKLEDALSGIYVIQIKCPNCQRTFSVDNVLVPMGKPQPSSKTEEIGFRARRTMLSGILIIVCSLLITWVMMPIDTRSPNYFSSGLYIVGGDTSKHNWKFPSPVWICRIGGTWNNRRTVAPRFN